MATPKLIQRKERPTGTQNKMMFNGFLLIFTGIILGLISIPLILIFIGIPMMITSAFMIMAGMELRDEAEYENIECPKCMCKLYPSTSHIVCPKCKHLFKIKL